MNAPKNNHREKLKLVRLGIDTHQEPVVYMRADCRVCRSEGFDAQSRVRIHGANHSIIATLNIVTGDILHHNEAGLSEAAWRLLKPEEGEWAIFSHPRPLLSFAQVRGKVHGKPFSPEALEKIIQDIVEGRYADVQLASFVTVCGNEQLNLPEIQSLTQAMVKAGDQLEWPQKIVVDKHCVGGLPGNRTTPIIVSIVTSLGLTMPKTSSRAITSPAGTADTMETLAPIALSLPEIRRVVAQEGGCIVWGGSVRLSPADDILIRVERALDLDSEGQLVASVLSKKAAAGSTHVILDVPVGPTAKVRDIESANALIQILEEVGKGLGLLVRAEISDGMQPVGRGIGPALEAKDVLAVLQNDPQAPQDLRDRSLRLSGHLLELAGVVKAGSGFARAEEILRQAQAWKKFQAICQAQGGMRQPPDSNYQHPVVSTRAGTVTCIDNRRLARVAKLAGAPDAKAAGVGLHKHLGDQVERGEPMFTLHTETPGEMDYALEYLAHQKDIIVLEES